MDAVFHLLERRGVADSSKDENVGSARNATTSGFVSTLILNSLIFTVLILLFIILRRTNPRTYAPRTYVKVVERWRQLNVNDDDKDGYADVVEGVGGFSGLFSWIGAVWKIPDETVLRTSGLDGYFFLRYLRKAQLILFVGCCLTWPLLFPLNATGGGGQLGLDILSYSNISKDNKNRLYAHVFIGWIFFAFILFTIYRELIFFTTLKQAYMLSPIYATRMSARTLLVQTVPEEYLKESALRRMFEHVSRVWIPTDTSELNQLVKERDKVALKLEAAEVKLIKLADKARTKNGIEVAENEKPGQEAEGESGSVAARYLPRSERPTHRLKPLVGEKVDTIDWCRGKLAELTPKIEELQTLERNGEGKKFSSAFIEFHSQSAAQVALQTLAHNKPLHMAPRYVGITPEEVIWSNMRLLWWERLVKVATTTAFVVVLVIFWSIPVAVTASISQINYLVEKVPFLKFINDIPEVILGLVTAMLPAVMLAVLMALLPIVLRLMAKISGLPSASLIEYRVQNTYFLFQVIQVFLVTTMFSAASSVVPQILKDPSSAANLLAQNLPKASNFYIAFMILQGLTISSGALLQAAGLILYKLLSKLFDNTPRKMWNRWSSLSGLGWGTVFPVYTNITVIAITYSIISPLVMGFGMIGLGLFYFSYRYNLLFVYNTNINTQGSVYTRALYQTLTGVYLAQICLIGLFAIITAIGPLILQILFLIFTVLFHSALNGAIEPLLLFLPRNLEVEEEALLSIEDGLIHTTTTRSTTIEDGLIPTTTRSTSATDGNGPLMDPDGDGVPGIDLNAKPSVLARFFHPEKYESYHHMRARLPKGAPEILYSPETERDAYYNPSIASTPLTIWIPRDAGGVSKQEVAHTSSVNPISDSGAIINSDGKVERREDAFPPDWREKPLW